MPNCFQLTRKSDVESGPEFLQKIDEEICNHLNVRCDEIKYCNQWYDYIGLGLACGRSFDEIRKNIEEILAENDDVDFWNNMMKIVDFLDENFTTDSFYMPKG